MNRTQPLRLSCRSAPPADESQLLAARQLFGMNLHAYGAENSLLHPCNLLRISAFGKPHSSTCPHVHARPSHLKGVDPAPLPAASGPLLLPCKLASAVVHSVAASLAP